MSHPDDCTNPGCIICIWVGESIIRFNDAMKAAILASAADIGPITYRTWLPALPENRRLPMPLKYAAGGGPS